MTALIKSFLGLAGRRATCLSWVFGCVVALSLLAAPSCSMARTWREGVETPLTPEESKAQVIHAARDIVRTLHLKGAGATFRHSSCNDQGETPFRGLVQLDYDHPPTTAESIAEVNRMVDILVQNGWSRKGDFHSHSPSVTKDGVTALFDPYNGILGGITLHGECRDMTTKEGTSNVPIPPDQLS